MRIVVVRVLLSLLLSSCAGCGANIELQRGATSLQDALSTSTFYLILDDGSKSDPDNVDGFINLMWTDDQKREAVVAEHIQFLKSELIAHGFNFVSSQDDSTVLANLRIKSVRYDPAGGWITDDASLVYSPTLGGADLGTVLADEIFFTPTVKMVFEALVKGSLELWGKAFQE